MGSLLTWEVWSAIGVGALLIAAVILVIVFNKRRSFRNDHQTSAGSAAPQVQELGRSGSSRRWYEMQTATAAPTPLSVPKPGLVPPAVQENGSPASPSPAPPPAGPPFPPTAQKPPDAVSPTDSFRTVVDSGEFRSNLNIGEKSSRAWFGARRCSVHDAGGSVPPLTAPEHPVITDGCPDFVELAHLSEKAARELEAAAEADRAQNYEERDQRLASVTGDGAVVDGCGRCGLSFLLSDPNQPGHPILYASPAFLKLTGFTAEEARVLNETQQLNGPDTDVQSLMAIARGMQEEHPMSVRLRLYDKYRQPFWSVWWMTPLFDQGKLKNWLGLFIAEDDCCAGKEARSSASVPKLWLPKESVTDEMPSSEEVRKAMTTIQGRYAERGDKEEILAAVSLEFVTRCFSTAGAMKRSFSDNSERLSKVFEWRAERLPWSIQEAEVQATLECGALFWSGFTTKNSPVLYCRPGRIKKVDAKALELAHIWALERGLQLMPPGVTGFAVVVDTSGLGAHHLSTELCRLLRPLVTVAYSNRMDACIAGPSNAIANAAWRILRAFLPTAVSERVVVTRSPRLSIESTGLIRPQDIPDFVQ